MGWFSPFGRRYMEFTPDGKELASYPVSVPLMDVHGLALCDDNSAWLGVSDPSMQGGPMKEQHSMLTYLDRAHGTWTRGRQQPLRTAGGGFTDSSAV